MTLPFPFRRERTLLDLLVSTEQGTSQNDGSTR